MADNTIVLFTADHGNMLGDRGRWFKDVMWEGSSHVPLIWRGPKGSPENKGKVVKQVVENTDLMPTLLESAGLPVPAAGVQGRSFVKLMRHGDPAWKDRALAQLATAMVRTSDYKFIDLSQNLSGNFELYDMRNDPKEERNLIDDPGQKDRVEFCKSVLTTWRGSKPAPVKIAAMATPDYLSVTADERKQLLHEAQQRDASHRKAVRRAR
jgi:arylsulfatase A-like enzyme